MFLRNTFVERCVITHLCLSVHFEHAVFGCDSWGDFQQGINRSTGPFLRINASGSEGYPCTSCHEIGMIITVLHWDNSSRGPSMASGDLWGALQLVRVSSPNQHTTDQTTSSLALGHSCAMKYKKFFCMPGLSFHVHDIIMSCLWANRDSLVGQNTDRADA
eukprot:5343991-Amphidinium_carterae.1